MTLADARKRIEKEFGKDTHTRASDGPSKVESVSTGVLSLDGILGVGGMPRGRIIEVSGQPSAGKTWLALRLAASVQKEGGTVAFVDVEHAFDLFWAHRQGVDLSEDRLALVRPQYAEQALTQCQIFAETGTDLIVLDSIGSLVPEKQAQDEYGTVHIAGVPRLLTTAMKNLRPICFETGSILYCINQLRANISGYGDATLTPGGWALKHAASIRLKLQTTDAKGKIVKDGKGNPLAQIVKAHVAKSNVDVPGKEAEYEIDFDQGYAFEADLAALSIEHELVEQKGAWISFADVTADLEERFQGKPAFVDFLRGHPPIAERLRCQVLEAMQDTTTLEEVMARKDYGTPAGEAEVEADPQGDLALTA